MLTGNKVSLQDVLDDREERGRTIQTLLGKNPTATVLCFKLNIPGDVKTNDDIVFAFNQGVKAWEQVVTSNGIVVTKASSVFKNTGPTYYCVVSSNTSTQQVKQLALNLEETHALGRLFDFDTTPTISRTDIGHSQRKCLLCNNPAVQCARGQTHNLSELQQHIHNLIRGHL